MPQVGAIMYNVQYNGKNSTTRKIIKSLANADFRRKPGTPSYHSAANNC